MYYQNYDKDKLNHYKNYDPGGEDVESMLNKLIGQQQMIRTTLLDEDEKVRSEFKQADDEINLKVDNVEEDLQAQINVNADEIEIRVQEDDVISAINVSPESIKIESDRLDIVGAVNVLSDITDVVGSYGSRITRITSGWIQVDGGGDFFTEFYEHGLIVNKDPDEVVAGFEYEDGTTETLRIHAADRLRLEANSLVLSGTVSGLDTSTEGYHYHTIDNDGYHNHGGTTGYDGGHNHGISDGTRLQLYDGGYVTWSSIGDHYHSIGSDGSHDHGDTNSAGSHNHDIS